MIKRTALLLLVLMVLCSDSYAKWRMNQYTGKQDYYQDATENLPSQTGEDGKFLMTDGSSISWETPTAGASGSDTQVQFNDGGTALGGDAGLTYNKTSDTLSVLGSIELGHASDTSLSRNAAGVLQVEGVVIPTISSTNTLTNKRITSRVVTTTDDATAVIDVDVTDEYELSAVANATTFSTTGTPTDGQKLIIRFKDAGAAKDLTWDSVFVAIGVTAPTTTVAGKWHYVGCVYNSAASKWHILATGVQA